MLLSSLAHIFIVREIIDLFNNFWGVLSVLLQDIVRLCISVIWSTLVIRAKRIIDHHYSEDWNHKGHKSSCNLLTMSGKYFSIYMTNIPSEIRSPVKRVITYWWEASLMTPYWPQHIARVPNQLSVWPGHLNYQSESKRSEWNIWSIQTKY